MSRFDYERSLRSAAQLGERAQRALDIAERSYYAVGGIHQILLKIQGLTEGIESLIRRSDKLSRYIILLAILQVVGGLPGWIELLGPSLKSAMSYLFRLVR